MLHLEVLWTIQDKHLSAPAELKDFIQNIKNIVIELSNDISSFDDVKKRKFQNMIRHIGLIELLNNLMVKLQSKMFYYRELYQIIIDFFYIVC